MDRNNLLEYIANGINAANKIQSIRSSKIREDSKSAISPSNIAMWKDILQILSEYAPESYKKPLEETYNKSNTYLNTYRDITNHLSTSKKRRFDTDHLIKSLNILRPIMKSPHQMKIDKIIKLYELFN
jgi:hypothetical protein